LSFGFDSLERCCLAKKPILFLHSSRHSGFAATFSISIRGGFVVKIFFFLLLLLSLSGCAQMTSTLEDQFRVDDAKIYRDSFTIRDKTIPLPPGDWKIAGSGLNSEKFFIVYFLQEHPGKLFSYIHISVDSLELNREYGYKPSEEIIRKDMHHTVLVGNTAGEARDWWLISAWQKTLNFQKSLTASRTLDV
jgi:hypothetical protein